MSERIKNIESGGQIIYWVDDVKEHKRAIKKATLDKLQKNKAKTKPLSFLRQQHFF